MGPPLGLHPAGTPGRPRPWLLMHRLPFLLKVTLWETIETKISCGARSIPARSQWGCARGIAQCSGLPGTRLKPKIVKENKTRRRFSLCFSAVSSHFKHLCRDNGDRAQGTEASGLKTYLKDWTGMQEDRTRPLSLASALRPCHTLRLWAPTGLEKSSNILNRF